MRALIIGSSPVGPGSPSEGLDPGPPAPVDLHEVYAADWITPGGVRANFVASVDGSATASGKSATLQTPGDNAVFATLRDLADVVVVGAATASAEGYRPISMDEQRRAIRARYGLSPVPATALVSNSLDLDLSTSLFQQAQEESPTLILTGPSAPMARRNDVIDLAAGKPAVRLLEIGSAGAGLDFAAAIGALQEFGYRRILFEGGPRLFASAVAAGGVSELCLSLSPLLVGPGGPRIVGGDPWQDAVHRAELVSLLEEGGALFCRYRLIRTQ